MLTNSFVTYKQQWSLQILGKAEKRECSGKASCLRQLRSGFHIRTEQSLCPQGSGQLAFGPMF